MNTLQLFVTFVGRILEVIMYRNVIKRIYLDIIPDSGAKTLEKLDEMIRKSIEESKKRTEWPDPENYK